MSKIFTSDDLTGLLASALHSGEDAHALQSIALTCSVPWSAVLARVAEMDCDVLVKRTGEPVVVRLVEAATREF